MKPEAINLKKLKIRFKSLGKNRCWGQTWRDGKTSFIELEKNMSERKLLTIFLHELTHNIFPDINSEKDIEKISCGIAKALWDMGYRRVIFDKKKKSSKKKK